MDWFLQLAAPGNVSLASTIVIYSFVIAAGVFLGKIKIGGISLGVTFVLFVGLLMGHLGYMVNGDVLHFIREFGLILFIFAIGLQVGPGFFTSFKKGGVVLNLLATAIIVLDVVIVLSIYFIDRSIPMSDLVGVMSGAVTNTPGLGAAQQAILQVSQDAYSTTEQMAMGYAAAYPLGVLGIILSMLVIKWIFKIKTDKEIEHLNSMTADNGHQPLFMSVEVKNRLIEGIDLVKLHSVITGDFVISRIKKSDGKIIIPRATSTIELGDILFVVTEVADAERFHTVIGPEINIDWESTPSEIVSRNIIVTKSEYNGVTLAALRLHTAYQLNATRVNRVGVNLLATARLRLQVGDKVTVVGKEEDIMRLADKLGNSLKRLNEPNLITLFIGILMGIFLGSLPISFPGISVPMKLGLAGGPLVVAILISRFGYKLHLVTYTSTSAAFLMRELGICLFLASVGIASGKNFAATVFNTTGMMWVLFGVIITVIPLLVVGFFARKILNCNYLTIMGLFGGSMTDPPALAYATGSVDNDAPAVTYSTVYPLAMFLRVVVAQILILCFV